jgi:hypothetical protein
MITSREHYKAHHRKTGAEAHKGDSWSKRERANIKWRQAAPKDEAGKIRREWFVSL